MDTILPVISFDIEKAFILEIFESLHEVVIYERIKPMQY